MGKVQAGMQKPRVKDFWKGLWFVEGRRGSQIADGGFYVGGYCGAGVARPLGSGSGSDRPGPTIRLHSRDI